MNQTAPDPSTLKNYPSFFNALDDGIKVGDLVWARYRGWQHGDKNGDVVLHRVQGYSIDNPSQPTVLKSLEEYERRGGDYHGHFFNRFLKANEQSAEVDDLVRRALKAAQELGYCAETKNVIRKMGLTIPRETTTVTVEVTVESDGKVSEDALLGALTMSAASLPTSKVTFKKA